MRVGIDARVLGDKRPTGIGKYTFELIRNILAMPRDGNEYVLFVSSLDDAAGFDARVVVIREKKWPFIDSHWRVARVMDQAGLDVIHFPAGVVPFFLRTPYIITVHDLAFYRHPEWFTPQLLSRILTKRGWRKSRRLIAVSEFTKNELLDFGFPGERISVIHEASTVESLPEARKGASNYFVFVGTLEPRKNILTLLKGFRIFNEQNPDVKLYLLGKEGWHADNIISEIRSSGNVIWRDYLPDEEKNKFLGEAMALVYPSWYEGFGLPVLEAMTIGVPVVASRVPAVVEVAGDAALLFNPWKPEELAEAMGKIYREPESVAALIKKGRDRAAQFSWQKAAEETIACYKQVTGF